MLRVGVKDEGETADMTRLAQQVLGEAIDLGNYERDKEEVRSS